MMTVIHIRTAGEFDWEHRIIELHRLPQRGEYIAMPKEGREGEIERHEVQMVTHLPVGGEAEAEVHCTRIGHIQWTKLGWTNTLKHPESPAPVLLTLEQAAEASSTSVKTLRRLIEQGRLEAIDCGTGGRFHNWRISPEALRSLKPVRREPEPVPQPSSRRGRRPRAAASSSARQYLPDA